jgi:very-short-patch-repair endonuclease
VIEVDGPGHRGKWANDRSRDQLLEDAGIAYVLRIAVEDTENPMALNALIDRLLGRLAP